MDNAAEALSLLAGTHPDLATGLASIIATIANEAKRTPRFATALTKGMIAGAEVTNSAPARRSGRRSPGVLDPFAVYAEGGEGGLRERLSELELEQLRDIVAEHGMDQDRLAMKWKDSSRVAERIIERVAARSAKGSAFR
ncbi:hypothetical protein LWC33_07670 [Pseudonocardia sp. RS11V-5]|uniref:hypothetical protein n=1 Tax=Pseudonocardia terrae TaxID=2905831 RepID=UPI001E469C31|nr:hypothetical protein [Pseudonocardia terrae]MCE3551329.1 hypothetical protein [Pseudonocardia terrae]